jgi:hypothetical protein
MFHKGRSPSAAVCLAGLTLANVTAVADWEVTPMCYTFFLQKDPPKTSIFVILSTGRSLKV